MGRLVGKKSKSGPMTKSKWRLGLQAGWEVRGNELWLIPPSGGAYVPPAEDIYNALVERRPTEIWVPTSVDGLRASRYPLTPTLVIKENTEGVPSYSVSASSRGMALDIALHDLERGHTIADGVWYPIEPRANAEVSELLRGTGADIGPARSLKAFLAIRKAAATGGPVEDRMAGKVISPLVFAPQSGHEPVGINAKLYPYQLMGWRWLKFLLSEDLGGLLADEMGLGKTLQIIGALSDSGGAPLRPALIIAPGSLLENWRREIDKFAPHLNVLKHHGPLRTGRPAVLLDHDVVITSYDSAVGDNSLLNMVRWKVIILDEAQYIRNPNAQRTRAVKRLQRDAGLAVTGTPIENRLLDMWSIMDFVLPGYLGDAKSFETNFPDDVDSAAQLEPLVSPLMLRRRIADVAQDLPPRIDIPQMIELHKMKPLPTTLSETASMLNMALLQRWSL